MGDPLHGGSNGMMHLGWMRISAIATMLLAAAMPSNTAAANCEAETHQLASLARTVSVDIVAPQNLAAGGSIGVAWNVTGSFPAKAPVYLVLSVPGEVRFKVAPLAVQADAGNVAPSGTTIATLPGFIALPPQARAPLGLTFGETTSRALVPLHQPGVMRQASFEVQQFAAGDLTVKAAIVAVTACGERELVPTVGKSLTIAPGRPEIVVQDPFDVERPQRVIVSAGRRYRANIFEDRYRVYDIETGARLVDRAGHDPNFSPTGRFVAAAVGDKGTTLYEIIDLVSREVVTQASGPFIGWTHGDAYLIAGQGSWGGLVVRPTLVTRQPASVPIAEVPTEEPGAPPPEDQLELRHPGSCHACASWTDADMMLDLDNGILVFSGSFEPDSVEVHELASGAVLCCRSAAERDRFIGANYAVRPFAMGRGWQARESIRFTHIYDALADPQAKHLADQTWFQGAKPLRDRLLRAETIDPSAAPVRVAGLSGASVVRSDWRTRVPRGNDFLTSGAGMLRSRIATDLSRLGLELALPEPRETISVVNSWAGKDRRAAGIGAAGIGATSEDYDRIDAMIDKRTRPLEARLEKEVPEIARHLKRRKVPSEVYEPPLPLEGLDKGNIDLASTLQGLWRWNVSGRPVWLMQLWATEGNAGIGQGMILLLEGSAEGRRGNGSITDLTERLAPFWSGAYGISDHQTQLKPNVYLDRYLVAGSVAQKSIVVLDLQSKLVLALFKNVPQADLMEHVELSLDGRHVVQFNSDGQFFIHDVEVAQLALSGRSVDEETIVYTPEGFYWSSYEGAHFVQLRFPGLPGLYPFQQFAAVLDRPAVIKAALNTAGAPLPHPAIAPPPVLSVTRSGETARDGSVQLRFEARATAPLARLSIYADARLIEEVPLSGLTASKTLRLPGLGNARWLTLQVADASGFVSIPQALRLEPTVAAATLRGVLVGVDRYSDPKLTLRFAESDAKRLGQALDGSIGSYYANSDVAVLQGGKAGRDGILAALARATQAAAATDTLVFAFAGHGIQDADGRYYLTPSDFDASRVAETGLAWAQVAELLHATKVRVVVILDACHAGLSGSEKLGTNDDAAGALLGARRAPMLVLAASKGRQVSYENAKWGGGLFTYALVEALQRNRKNHDLDHDGAIAVSELYRAVKGILQTNSEGQQTPWLARQDLIGDFALF